MKIHRFTCNVCGLVFGLDNTGWGITRKFEIVNPRDAEDIHLCNNCILEIGRISIKMNLEAVFNKGGD